MSARRFLWRWNLRMLRLEWRQNIGVFTLITVAVALSVGSVVGAFNLAEPPGFRYGTGAVRATITGDNATMLAALESQGNPFGTIESGRVRTPGAKQTTEIRVMDPDNPVTAPLLRLSDGRFPTGSNEVAATVGTPGVGRALGAALQLGDRVALDGTERLVVGLVENPTRLDDEFVLVQSLDDYGIDPARRATLVLVDAPPIDVTFPAGTGSISTETRGDGTELAIRTTIAIAVNVVAAVALLLVALLVGAAFAVLARRRSRQYGLLAAAGATPRQLRTAATANGVALGTAAALLGAFVGIAVTAMIVPRMEQTVGHRIDLAVPWWSVVPTVTLAALAAAVAAWWPSRALSRQPIVQVLASIRPNPSSTTGSARIGVLAIVVGAAALVVGTSRLTASIIVAGIVGSLLGMLLLSPMLIRAIGRFDGRLPLAGRMAGRAIARNQGRSAALVSALTIALAIPVGLAVVTASIDDHAADEVLNLADNMAIAWAPGVEQERFVIPAELSSATADDAGADRIRAALPDAAVVPIRLAVDPSVQPVEEYFDGLGTVLAIMPTFAVRPFDGVCGAACDVITLGERDADGNELELLFHEAWIGDSELLDALNINDAAFAGAGTGGARTEAITLFDDTRLSSHRGDQPDSKNATVINESTIPANTSIAATLISPDTVADNGWEPLTVGWLVVDQSPLTLDQRTALTQAVGDELLLETTLHPVPQTGVRAIGIIIGALISLGILSAALALLASDSADDMRILQSIGAGPSNHRRLSAATASILAAAGAIIAVPTGYLALLVLLADKQTSYRFAIPWLSLLSITIVLPVLAGAFGWLTSRTRTTNLASGL